MRVSHEEFQRARIGHFEDIANIYAKSINKKLKEQL